MGVVGACEGEVDTGLECKSPGTISIRPTNLLFQCTAVRRHAPPAGVVGVVHIAGLEISKQPVVGGPIVLET